MGGTPSQIAQQAGVLFENADNPGNPQVQAILPACPPPAGNGSATRPATSAGRDRSDRRNPILHAANRTVTAEGGK